MLWHLHYIVYKQLKYYRDLRLYVLFMLKPRHAHYRTFRTEEQLHIYIYISVSPQGVHHKVSPQGG